MLTLSRGPTFRGSVTTHVAPLRLPSPAQPSPNPTGRHAQASYRGPIAALSSTRGPKSRDSHATAPPTTPCLQCTSSPPKPAPLHVAQLAHAARIARARRSARKHQHHEAACASIHRSRRPPPLLPARPPSDRTLPSPYRIPLPAARTDPAPRAGQLRAEGVEPVPPAASPPASPSHSRVAIGCQHAPRPHVRSSNVRPGGVFCVWTFCSSAEPIIKFNRPQPRQHRSLRFQRRVGPMASSPVCTQ